jgi:septal ring factor EnvC (AmiA/AmiB activator)
MIPRRPRRTDPRHVLGSALALALPLGMGLTASAQPAAPPPAVDRPASDRPVSDANALEQRDRELEDARAEQRKAAETLARLKREIESLSEDRRKLNQQLIDTAARVREVEASVVAAEARLKPLDENERTIRRSFEERRAVIAEILAALQRIGRQPPPALMVRPEDALQAVRTAITLGAVLPGMRAQAEALAGDLADLLRVRKEISEERRRLSADLAMLGTEQLRMSLLIEERQRKQGEAEKALDSERQRAVALSRQVDNLRDLIAKLEQELNSAARAARAAARSADDAKTDTRPSLATLKDPGRLAPAVAFVSTRGNLPLPVNGVKIREFGAADAVGGTEKGLSLAARPGAQVTAPCDGWVVYAGTFRSYGQLLILNAGGGYHILLAGMERISVDLGQFVLAGEPVAVMGGPQLSAVAASSKQPVLYVEFRKDGTPVDPSPWWAKSEVEKVRG